MGAKKRKTVAPTPDARSSARRDSPDFTQRRGLGLYENEVSSVYHLPFWEMQRISKNREYRAENRGRLKVIAELDQLFIEKTDDTRTGYAVGWNAALDAVIRVIRYG